MLEVENLHKEFQSGSGEIVAAVDGVSFTVQSGQAFTLLGTSGCGKTSTLRCVAGLERPSRGRIRLNGETLFDSEQGIFVPANRRGIGMVFQSYAIWPHMNVFQNVAFPLRVARRGRAEIEKRVMTALDMVQLAHLAKRPAPQLSGGQQQRLAVARALVQEPKLLLLDEPLSNLDAKLREQMRFELKALQQRLGVTTVYVTHDQSEAMILSDQLAVMSGGKIVQMGAPETVYDRPSNLFVADFIGRSNLVRGRVAVAPSGGRCRVTTGIGELVAVCPYAAAVGDDVAVSLRPENIQIGVERTAPDQHTNAWPLVVRGRIFHGETNYYLTESGADTLRILTPAGSRIAPGKSAFARISIEECVVVPLEGAAPHG